MQTIYERLGAENLQLMVDNFYDLVLQNETIAPLFKTDISEVKRKQFMFLTQFFGGPGLYAEEFGHPRMRMRHMPHKIDESATIEWLLCMKGAIMKLPIDTEFQNEIFQRFPRTAAHMMNS